jgi:hypothetical protein
MSNTSSLVTDTVLIPQKLNILDTTQTHFIELLATTEGQKGQGTISTNLEDHETDLHTS